MGHAKRSAALKEPHIYSVCRRLDAASYGPAGDLDLCPERGVVAERVPPTTDSHAFDHVAGQQVVQDTETQLVG